MIKRNILHRLFAMELKRAFYNRNFFLTIVLMVLMEIVSSSLIFTNIAFGVDEILDNLFSGTGSATVLLMLFPLLPYAISYAKDMEDGALDYYMVRTDIHTFLSVRFIVAVFSAFACVVISFVIFSTLLYCMGHPITNGVSSGDGEGYNQFLGSEPFLYFLCYSVDRGMSAAMMAASAVFLSVLYSNSFFAFTAPVCLYFLSVRLVFPNEVNRLWLHPDSWIEGVYNSAYGGFATLFYKTGVMVTVCLVYEVFALIIAKRRWHYA